MALFQTILAVIYPLLIYVGLGVMEPRSLAFCIAGVLAIRLLVVAPRKLVAYTRTFWVPVAAMAGMVMLTAAFNHPLSLLLTPVVINLGLLMTFLVSFAQDESTIERLAKIQVPDLSAPELSYCRRVTGVWCVFFLVNGSVAFALAAWGTLSLWTFYTGILSYVLIGVLFAVEYIYRHWRFRRYLGAPTDFLLKRIFPPADQSETLPPSRVSAKRASATDSQTTRPTLGGSP
ncbi:MAG: hypothetical protein OSB70_05125 [Myxococcota bacterium]|nr:hypothetical protein [Myxococcota bacterium]